MAWERVEVPEEPGLVRFQNVGTHAAFDVTVVLTINDERVTLSPGEVPPGAYFEHDARGAYWEAERERDRKDAEFAGSGILAVFSTRFDVGARISWQSELGNPGIVTL